MSIKLASIEHISEILDIVEDARELISSLNFKQWTKESNYPNYNSFFNDINNKNLYVFEDNGKIVAFMAIIAGKDPNYEQIEGKWLTTDKNYLTIHRLAVKKEYYGNQIAQKLIDFALNYAKIQNISSVRIDTHPSNKPMNNLIIKKEFKYCGFINILDDKIDPKRNAYEKVI